MPLKPKEIEEYKKQLLQMQAQLNKTVRGNTEQVKTPDESAGYSQHQADQGTDDFDRTINLELTSHEYDVLRQIERALEKIEEGSYGICDISDKEIPKKRLDAMPYAVMTVDAQSKLEKGQIISD